MEPNLQTLPHYFKTETSPMIQHSAFPPFKIEHRYRGVYERAGFDVNLKGNSTSVEGRSIKSPMALKFNLSSPPSSANSINSSKRNEVNNVVPSSAKTSKSFGELERHTPYPVYENIAHSESEPNTSRMPLVSPSVKSTYTQMSDNYQPQGVDSNNTQVPIIQIQHEDSTDNAQLPPPNKSGFVFIQPGQSKNLKNLSLNLNDQVRDANHFSGSNEKDDDSIGTEFYDTSSETSVGKFKDQKIDARSKRSSQSSIKTDELISSSLVQTNHGLPSPPPTSKSHELQPDDSLIKKQRLSSALNEFRKDIEDHKNYIPKSPSVPNSPAFKEAPQLPTASPSHIGLTKFEPSTQNGNSRFSYNQNYVDNINGDSLTEKDLAIGKNISPSDQFEHFRDEQFATDDQLNSEYQNFLKLGTKNEARDSQVSMVSSIISKESDYGQEDDDENALMERQLQALKVGDNNDISSVKDGDMKAVEPSADNIALSGKPKANGIINTLPTFNIENMDEDNAEDIPRDSTDPQNSQDSEEHSNNTWESIKPLSVHHSDDKDLGNYDSKNVKEEPLDNTTDDAIEVKPLSPKNHLVEEELKNMNFPVQNVSQTEDLAHDESSEYFKYPPGEGPCRVCKKKTFSSSRGPLKSVFSKTGELSGQWHRSCFTCEYSGCTVHFTKSIQCYVFDDNAFCHKHYHELNDTLCQNCSNGIEGECVENELHQKWHLYCLTCHKCHNQINTDYYLINGASYCDVDAVNIINNGESYEDVNGNTKTGGLTTSDKVEKRRTRIMYVE